ncbi:MAG: family efflux transporter permease subunit, partial [Chloroflexi bacterium]|nr:family efflux transporter permease subunit [Chloroflexota bacterium]
AVAIGWVFARYEMTAEQPILDPRLFRNPIFADSVLITFLIGAGMFGAISYIPLFVQGVIGASATGSGAVLTPLMVTAIAGSVISGQLMSRLGRYRNIALAGLLIMMAGTVIMARLTINSTTTDVAIGMVVLGLGLGLGMSLYTVVVQNAFSRDKLGQVTSALTFFRSIGGTIGIAVMGSFLTGNFSSALRSHMAPGARAAIPQSIMNQFSNPQVLLSSETYARLKAEFAHLLDGHALLQAFTAATRAALASSLHDVFLVGLAISGLAFIAALFLQEIPLRGRDSVSQPDQAA